MADESQIEARRRLAAATRLVIDRLVATSAPADLKVGWPVVGHLVERAIASGLRDTLRAEVSLVERWHESS